MINYSKPKFISVEEARSIIQKEKTDNKTMAFCQCPLPLQIEINGVKGGYCHVVEYEKTYVCKDCGTKFSVGKRFA